MCIVFGNIQEQVIIRKRPTFSITALFFKRVFGNVMSHACQFMVACPQVSGVFVLSQMQIFQASVNVWPVSKVAIVRCLAIAGVTALDVPIDALVIMPTLTDAIQSMESVFANRVGKVSIYLFLIKLHIPQKYILGVQCESMCETGRYGSNCQFQCDCGDNGSSCEAQSGKRIVYCSRSENNCIFRRSVYLPARIHWFSVRSTLSQRFLWCWM